MPPVVGAKKEPVKPVTSAAKVETPPTKVIIPTGDLEREVIYPEVKIAVRSVAKGKPLYASDAKLILGWQTEEDNKAQDPKRFVAFGDEYDLLDSKKRKVKFWNNANNRPFDEQHARRLAQDMLQNKWAFNLETIIISKTGMVQSGQHRLGALCIAQELWEADKYWQERWAAPGPFIECLIAFGASEDPEVVRTLDNVKPRTLMDVFYTSGIFVDADGSQLPTKERKELSRMADYATDMMWQRTNANEKGGQAYQTHSASLQFIENHPTLLEAVRKIFDLNKTRVISKLSLSPGQVSALWYLMATSCTDPDLGYLEKRCEKDADKNSIVNFDNLETAAKFWEGIAKDLEEFKPVKTALGQLKDPDGNDTGRLSEKFAILIKAWLLYASEEKITPEGLKLEYVKNSNDEWKLVESPTCGGIDFGGFKEYEPEKEGVAPAEESQEKKREERAKKAIAKIEETPEQEKARRAAIEAGEIDEEEDYKEEIEEADDTEPSEDDEEPGLPIDEDELDELDAAAEEEAKEATKPQQRTASKPVAKPVGPHKPTPIVNDRNGTPLQTKVNPKPTPTTTKTLLKVESKPMKPASKPEASKPTTSGKKPIARKS